jgi:hypothetical protein
MKSFKNFLRESEEVIFKDETMRDILYRRYGKEKADEIIASIRARDASEDEKVKELKALTKKEFVIPDYSDKNLDKSIKVVTKTDMPGGAIAMATPERADSDKPSVIALNPDYPRNNNPIIDEIQTKSKPVTSLDGSSRDTLKHEGTHTLQFGTPLIGRTFPMFTGADTKDDKERKYYTQNAYEPAARMSELKSDYFRRTGIILKADMTDDDYKKFIDWYNTTQKFKDGTPYDTMLQDTIDVIETTPGRELFRRVAKKDTPNNTGAMQA